MSSNWRRIVALVAIVMLGWFLVSQSGGQEDIFREVPAPAPDKTLLAPNAQPVPRVQWEYHVEIGGAFRNDTANTLGRQGWELVTIYQQHDGEFRAIYKRPRQ